MNILCNRDSSDLAIYQKYAGQDIWIKIGDNNMYYYINVVAIVDDMIYFRFVDADYVNTDGYSDNHDIAYECVDEVTRSYIVNLLNAQTIIRPLDLFTTDEMEELLGTELNSTENLTGLDDYDL